jgi:hypothetical protein
MDIFGYTGIVVASNNNTAVENISQELPARKKVSREFSEASYLNDVAASVVAAQGITGDDKKPLVTWGLIAAVLGNKTNRKSFCWGLFQDDKKPEEGTDPKDPKAETPNVPTDAADERPASDSSRDTLPTIKQSLEQCTKERQKWKKEWEDAKSAFNKKAKEFESIQEEFAKANKELIESNQLQRQLAEMRNALAEYKRRLAEMAEEQQAIRDDYIAAQANHDAAASRLTTEKITRKPSLLIQILQYSLILSIAKLFGYKNRAYLAWTANLSRLQSELDTAARQAWIQPVDATDWLNRSAGVS